MKKLNYLNGITLVALTFGASACSRNIAKKSETQLNGPRTEKVVCKGSTTTSFKDPSGVKREIEEHINEVIREVVPVGNGKETSDVKGEISTTTYELGEDQSKTFKKKKEYTYVSHKTSVKTVLPNGDKRIEIQFSKIDTAKAGSKLINEKGEEVETRTSEHSAVNVVRTTGDKTVDIYSSYDGKDQPIYDYVTVTKYEKGAKIETSTLLTPFTDVVDENFQYTVEKDEQVCTTVVVK